MEIDYEKEYTEALERAKRLRDSKYQTMNAKRVAEEIFPVLAESEDERVRKELIAILKKSYNSGITLNNKKDLDRYLAYLERQKEPENVSATTMIPSCWEVEQKEQKPPIAGNDFGWIDELKHDLKHPEELDEKVQEVLKKRQKPVERSLEDDHIIGFVYDLLNEIEWKDNWAMSKEECLGRLKSLRPQYHGDVTMTEAYKMGKEAGEASHWKPSEEQMKALEEVRTIFHHHHLWDEINPILYDYEELMRDLQKLL